MNTSQAGTIAQKFKSGISREPYRADLENFIRKQVPDVDITNEPSSVTSGNPDYDHRKQHSTWLYKIKRH